MKALDTLFAAACPHDGPGFVVAVARQGEVIYRRAFGMASIEHRVANHPGTRMRLASVTKHMACAAALLLAEDGMLDLDVPASRWLPELPSVARGVTLRQLMQHTSGQRCCLELAVIGGMRHLPARWCLEAMFRQQELSFSCGSSWLYNNGGYELLSEAITRASGLPFERLMRERLFLPLGMHDSVSLPDDMLIEPGIATFHQPTMAGGWVRGLTLIDDNRGAGAVVTTVDDMLRWLANLRGPSHAVGSPALWRQMAESAVLADGTRSGYGLGLYTHRYRGVDVLHHGGSLGGVASQIVTVPTHGLDIVIMTNGALVNPVQMAWQVVDIVLDGELHGEAPPLVPFPGLAHLKGTQYRAASGLLVGFDDVGGHLGLQLMGSPPMPVVRDLGVQIGLRVEETGFGPLLFDRASLAAGADGTPPAEIQLVEAGQAHRLTRLPGSAGADAGGDDALLGRYVSNDLGGRAEVVRDGGRLSMRLAVPGGGREFVLHPLGADAWTLSATDPEMPGFHALSAERKRGRVTTLRLDTVRVRRLRFDRVGP